MRRNTAASAKEEVIAAHLRRLRFADDESYRDWPAVMGGKRRLTCLRRRRGRADELAAFSILAIIFLLREEHYRS